MLQTLYKTPHPTAGPAVGAEFYEIFLEARRVKGTTVFFVREKHGWWDEGNRRAVHLVSTLSPEEGVSTWDEAHAIYQRQVERRVLDGFVHSYSPDFYGDGPARFVYRHLGKS
jgi:hypothetical protein